MAMSTLRFNLVLPGLDPKVHSEMHKAFLDMATFADQNGFTAVQFEEHHGAENGWSPTPLLLAGMALARTTTVSATIMALLAPLHDPLRIAEDIAVLDLVAPGRLMVVLGVGYRPSEYAAHDKEWSRRGRLMDEVVDTLLKAWTGEPFEYRGTTVRVTPRPVTQPHPMVFVGGTSQASARRAARFGLPFFPAAHLPELEAYYNAQCAEHGTQGFCLMPGEQTAMTHVATDPDKAWAEIGHHFLHEAQTYAGWQTADIHSAVHSHAKTVEELRAEGIYRVLSPEDCVAEAQRQGPAAAFNLHPMCGGMPIDKGWESLHLYAEQVLPKIP